MFYVQSTHHHTMCTQYLGFRLFDYVLMVRSNVAMSRRISALEAMHSVEDKVVLLQVRQHPNTGTRGHNQ